MEEKYATCCSYNLKTIFSQQTPRYRLQSRQISRELDPTSAGNCFLKALLRFMSFEVNLFLGLVDGKSIFFAGLLVDFRKSFIVKNSLINGLLM